MLRSGAAKSAVRVPLTPLIDVVFILLLFFMLSSTFGVEQHIALQQSNGKGAAQTTTRVQLLVLPSGEIKGDTTTWDASSDSFAERMRAWVVEESVVAIGATQDTPVQHLVDALARLNNAGVTNVRVFESVAL